MYVYIYNIYIYIYIYIFIHALGGGVEEGSCRREEDGHQVQPIPAKDPTFVHRVCATTLHPENS